MSKEQKTGAYDDIIDLPHHVSATRPQMSRLDRAAQLLHLPPSPAMARRSKKRHALPMNGRSLANMN